MQPQSLTTFLQLLVTLAFTAEAQQLLGNFFGIAGKDATFDYVVVGGGTAGLAVANRLAENGRYQIAVIEAGGFYEVENGNTSTVPAYCVEYGAFEPSSADDFPLVDWGFVTTPQAGLNNRTLHYGRGKMLGGRCV
jgi:choline dehydrogenase